MSKIWILVFHNFFYPPPLNCIAVRLPPFVYWCLNIDIEEEKQTFVMYFQTLINYLINHELIK